MIRECGPAWDASREMRKQERWDEHATFMEALAAEGFVVLGGPLGEGERVLHIVEAASTKEIEGRFAEDPWEPMGLLRTVQIDRWTILLEAPGASS